MWCWGDNRFGQLGLGHKEIVVEPTLSSFFSDRGLLVNHVVCGEFHTLVLVHGGRLFSFGSNRNGQLGIGNFEILESELPILVKFPKLDMKVTRISAGGSHNLATLEDGSLWSWGSGANGQLGHDYLKDCYFPEQILFFQGKEISTMTCGPSFTCVVVSASPLPTIKPPTISRGNLGYFFPIPDEEFSWAGIIGKTKGPGSHVSVLL
eukprot:TRINITY_DN6284_c0_g1_i4.p1 TRINITY_DN6284_c0_g1~~TRINITY_DN6284_c0_g1_i4.p1  ORF type:complete len:207 (-),score=41.64 TRINITY_DN6284_c0_g1_i4:907-1527(-)